MTADMNHVYYDSIPKPRKDIMEVVGDSGRWQRQIFLQMFFILALVALHNMSITFLAPNQDHWCSRPLEAANLSALEWKNVSLPTSEQHCSRYKKENVTYLLENHANRSLIPEIPCSSWEYDDTFYTSTTLTTKWNLVCEDKWLVSMSKTIFMIGMLQSAIIFGYIADRFGRKRAIIFASIVSSLFSILCPFSPSFVVFNIFRFFLAIGVGGYYDTAFILLMEITVPKKRALYAVALQTGWSFGFLCLPGVAWLIRDAFWIQVALAVITVLLMVFSGFVPESPRWLLSKGEVEKARNVLIQAANTNRLSGPRTELAIDEVIAQSKMIDESEKMKRNLLDLCRISGLRRITIFVFIVWFLNSFIYFGLSFNTNELYGNPFLNFALSGIMEFPACFLAIFIIRSGGRKKPLAASMIIGGILCLVLYLIPIDIPQTIVAAAMIGKIAITCSFCMLYVFTSELFPTAVRNAGLEWSTVWEGVGSIFAPFTKELAYATHPAIPQLLFGILSLAGGALVVFLPGSDDTVETEMPEDAVPTSRSKEESSETLKNSNNTAITNSEE